MHLDYKNPPKLPRSVLKDLLLFATKKSHFVFDGQYHEKIDKTFLSQKRYWSTTWMAKKVSEPYKTTLPSASQP